MTVLRASRGGHPARQNRRAALSGSGPVPIEQEPARNPGAVQAFALLGEVLAVGILVTVACLPILTLPAALAAAVGHLRRFLRAEKAPLSAAWTEFRGALLGGAVVAIGAVTLVLLLLLDIDLANSGALPGGPIVAVLGWAGLAAVGVVVLTAAGRWNARIGWRGALREAAHAVRNDPAGAGYTLATAVFAVIVTWQLIPLIVPALGCVVLAVVAIPQRSSRHRAAVSTDDDAADVAVE